jgi:hypothetical protein
MAQSGTAGRSFVIANEMEHILDEGLGEGMVTTPQASRHATDRIVAPPLQGS